MVLDPGGRGYSQKNWVGVCGPLPKTLTLFMTKICDFPYPGAHPALPYLWWPNQKFDEFVEYNYFIFDLIVMQCSVNKIFRCICSDYLLVASVYSVVLNTRSLCLVNCSSKTPGARPVTGTRDKPLRHVHKTVNIICEGLLLLVFSSLQSSRWRGRQSADGRRGTW